MSTQAGDIVLERFRLERPLASGAMGEVWVAGVLGARDKVAVKLATGDGAVRAHREAEALSRLAHPGVVRFVDAGKEGDTEVLVMEFLDGVPLSKRLYASPLEVGQSIELARQLAEALVHAHGQGVVHRDVKASNTLVVQRNGRDQAVLIDFGLGLVAGSPRVSSGDVVLGSSHTMPPEQVQGATAGPRADVYSLGSLVFRMVCGQYPFHASSPVQVLAMHAHARVPHFSERARRDVRVPPGLEELVHEMLAKVPETRPDAAAVAERLAALAEVPEARWELVEAVSKDADPDGVAPAPPVAPRRGALAAGVAALLLAAFVAWFLLA